VAVVAVLEATMADVVIVEEEVTVEGEAEEAEAVDVGTDLDELDKISLPTHTRHGLRKRIASARRKHWISDTPNKGMQVFLTAIDWISRVVALIVTTTGFV
jgi:D-alanyl-D-alanine dipeptidase